MIIDASTIFNSDKFQKWIKGWKDTWKKKDLLQKKNLFHWRVNQPYYSKSVSSILVKKKKNAYIFIPRKNKVTRNHKITIKFIKMCILMYYLNYFQTILLNNLYISSNRT